MKVTIEYKYKKNSISDNAPCGAFTTYNGEYVVQYAATYESAKEELLKRLTDQFYAVPPPAEEVEIGEAVHANQS